MSDCWKRLELKYFWTVYKSKVKKHFKRILLGLSLFILAKITEDMLGPLKCVWMCHQALDLWPLIWGSASIRQLYKQSFNVVTWLCHQNTFHLLFFFVYSVELMMCLMLATVKSLKKDFLHSDNLITSTHAALFWM